MRDDSCHNNQKQTTRTMMTPATTFSWYSCILFFLLWLPMPVVVAQFNWGNAGDCQGGQGEFVQVVPFQGEGVELGEIPPDTYNVEIRLKATNDLDVQLFDIGSSSPIPIIKWGALAPLGDSGSQECAFYESLEYCYSGYNGDLTSIGLGNEWIHIPELTNRPLSMWVWAYDRVGTATVTYSWDASPDCVPRTEGKGSGNFEQTLVQGDTVDVGVIPLGLRGVNIFLESPRDIDIQLFDGSVPIVEWKPTVQGQWIGGLLGRSTQESTEYEGMTISYSGYRGFDGKEGNEYITIQGTTTRSLSMKAFGFQMGSALVTYAWGGEDVQLDMDYASNVNSPIVFNALARRDDVPGAMGLREIKFVISDVGSPTLAKVHLINTKKEDLHYDFVRDALGWTDTLAEFQAVSYWSASRRNAVGSVLYHPSFVLADGAIGAYTLEFWPADPVQAPVVIRAFNLMKQALPFATNKLFFHPSGDTQLQAYRNGERQFIAADIPVIETDELFGNVIFSGLNPGRSVGFLRVVQPGGAAPSIRDIAIFTFVPPDLTHVAGIITEAPQTPLSHINLKAKQNKTPNAYIKDASQLSEITPLIGQIVAFELTADGFDFTSATQAEADKWLESVRPSQPQIPRSDLSAKVPQPLAQLRHGDWIRYGSKAANVAELNRLFASSSDVHTPDGYAVPFSMYDEFMLAPRCGENRDELCPPGVNGVSLYAQARFMMMTAGFDSNADIRKTTLETFRDRIVSSEALASAMGALENIRVFWDPQGPPYETRLRCRSSTNNEDLESFNGAGLYDSKTHKPSEGDLISTVKEVWSSLWTMRAFDERTFYRIDHFQTYMGVLIHPSYGDEQANGVAVTKNIYNPGWQGYYINSQYGEISVTNPLPEDAPDGASHAIPDELFISRITGPTETLGWETQYIRHSNVEFIYDDQPVPTENVLTPNEIEILQRAMQRIQNHFKLIYAGDSAFAMDIEFKITRTTDYDPLIGTQPARGELSVKQARPWID